MHFYFMTSACFTVFCWTIYFHNPTTSSGVYFYIGEELHRHFTRCCRMNGLALALVVVVVLMKQGCCRS